MDQLLSQPLALLPLAVRAQAYCAKLNIETIGQLAQAKRADMLKSRNMGRRTVHHIEAYLGYLGLGLDGKLAASVPAPSIPAFQRGAHAMRLAILTQMVAANMPHSVIQFVTSIAVPDLTEE